MRLSAILGIALRRLRQRPVRTLLLLQGTVWGVAVAVAPSAVIAGTREAARTRGTSLGADRITVTIDPTSARAAKLGPDDLPVVERARDDFGTPAKAVGGVHIVARLVRDGSDARGRPETDIATVLAATPGTETARGLTLEAGRWLRAGDGDDVCVVESRVAAWLGLDVLEPGQRLVLPARGPPRLATGNEGREIVGVAAARNAEVLRTNDIGFDIEHAMYKKVGAQLLLAMGIPLVSDGWKRGEQCIYIPRGADDETAFEWIFTRVPTAAVSDSADAVRQAFADEGKGVVTLYPIVLPLVMGEQVERFDAVNLAMFLACLLMGAVVMMNFGLLNALSRAREIAIRRTEGATQRDITWQFLFEGLLLAAIGGVLGCALGMGLAHLRASLEPVTGFTWVFPWPQATWAVLVAMLVGLLAAAVPARKAAQQDPVRGLADE